MRILSGELAGRRVVGTRPGCRTAVLTVDHTQVCPPCWCCPRGLVSPCATSSQRCSTSGEAPCLTLVISPLMSLMDDQVGGQGPWTHAKGKDWYLWIC